MAKEDRGLESQDSEVRERRTADTIGGIIRDRGRRRLPLEDIYRQLFNRHLYLRADGRLSWNKGTMTPGSTAETVDAMSLEKLEAIIDALRHERYRWTPVRRTYIPKKSGTRRALGLPTWSAKLWQEVIRSIPEAYYEPQFSRYSHGFRPGRGCHTALGEITKHWRGVKWDIEGDITQCFESLDHQVLLAILREQLHDNRLLRLIANLLKAGDLEEWRFNATLSGVPQGGVVSPILSSLYLDRLDQFVETGLRPTHNRGDRRQNYPPYKALLKAAWAKRKQGDPQGAKALRHQAQHLPSRDPNDPGFRRLWYGRYAADWLLGVSGPRCEAQQIKRHLAEFLRDTLKLELSQEKTLITHARTHGARFLGYDIVTRDADEKRDHRRQRCINGAPGLKVPRAVLRAKCARYRRYGKPRHLPARLQEPAYTVVTHYQAEYRGVVQDYLLAFKVHRLWALHRVMELSLAKTLADKYRTRVNQVFRRYQRTVRTPHGTHKVLEVSVSQDMARKPRVARFGGIELRWQKHTHLNDHPVEVFNSRSEVGQRLLAQGCELCGATEHCQVHHVRKLADLHRPGRREKPLWVRRMAARHRKTLVVCQPCPEAIHREWASGRRVKK